MSEATFDVVFFGILQANKDKDVVMQNMATLFKTDAAKLAPYFAGGRKVIKGNINAAAAEKYKSALENVGLVVKVEASSDEQQVESQATGQSISKPTDKEQGKTPQIDISGISIAPVGSNILEKQEEIIAQTIEDTSDISMAEIGSDVIENPKPVTPHAIEDTSDISMADVGSDVLENPVEIVAQKIVDTAELSMAEPGANIIDNPIPEEVAETPDTSGL